MSLSPGTALQVIESRENGVRHAPLFCYAERRRLAYAGQDKWEWADGNASPSYRLRMSNPNTDYEIFVRDITQALLRAQGLETVTVQHDVQVQGTSRAHQIDVYWEYRLGGVLHRIVINTKRYKSSVEVTDVLTLSGVLADMPGVRGLIVTTVGFQKGAIDYAQTHQIGLKVIRPPEDSDWTGRLREICLDLRFSSPELISCSVNLNREWLEANIVERPDSVAGSGTYSAATTAVRDLDTGAVSDMQALWNRAMQENPTETGQEGRGILRWKDARFESAGATPLKVDSIAFHWRVVEGASEIRTIRSEPAAIVRDAIAGTLLFVDSDGGISGDVEEELGAKGR